MTTRSDDGATVEATPPPACGVWQTLEFLKDPAAFTAGPGLALGDLYRLSLPGHRLLVATDPEWAEAVLVRHADAFGKSRIYWRTLRRMIGDSLGSLDDARWRYLHGVERPFFTPRAVDGYLERIARATAEHLDRLREEVARDDGVAILESFAELNARTLLSLFFGRVQEPRAREVARRIVDAHEIVAWKDKYPWRPMLARVTGRERRAQRHARFFEEYVRDLREHRPSDSGPTLLDALASVEADPGAPPLSSSLVRNEVVFHLGAGIETQAAAEAWTLYLLWRHPAVLERLRDEVDEVELQAGGGPVSARSISALPWTRCVIDEALRLYPPVHGILRDCLRPVEIGGYRVRPGEAVLLGIYGIHRSPRLWEDPGVFRPERFLRSAPSVPRYRYLPFGAGRHVCIGQHVALPAMVLLVASFASRFDWWFDSPDLRPDPRPSLKPAAPCRIGLAPRTDAGRRAPGGG